MADNSNEDELKSQGEESTTGQQTNINDVTNVTSEVAEATNPGESQLGANTQQADEPVDKKPKTDQLSDPTAAATTTTTSLEGDRNGDGKVGLWEKIQNKFSEWGDHIDTFFGGADNKTGLTRGGAVADINGDGKVSFTERLRNMGDNIDVALGGGINTNGNSRFGVAADENGDGHVGLWERISNKATEKVLAKQIPGFKDMSRAEQDKALAEAYKKYDKNGDGNIGFKEGFGMATNKLNMAFGGGDYLTGKTKSGTIADKNGDGKVSIGERLGNAFNNKRYERGYGDAEGKTAWGGNADRNGDGKVDWTEALRNRNNEKALSKTIKGFDNMSHEDQQKALAEAFDEFDTNDDGKLDLGEHLVTKMSKHRKIDDLMDKWFGEDSSVGNTMGAIATGVHNIVTFNPLGMFGTAMRYGSKAEREQLAKMTPEEKKQYFEDKKQKAAEMAERNKLQAKQSASTSFNNIANNPPVMPANNMSWLDKIKEQRLSMLGGGRAGYDIPVKGNIRRSRSKGWDQNIMEYKRSKLFNNTKNPNTAVSDARLKDYIVGAMMNDTVLENLQKLFLLEHITSNKVIQGPNGNTYLH